MWGTLALALIPGSGSIILAILLAENKKLEKKSDNVKEL